MNNSRLSGEPATAAPRSAVVVGAGPAGYALTHRLLHHGVRTTLIDPHPAFGWQSTFAAWTDELPEWLSENVIGARTDAVRVHGHTPRTIARPYSILDNTALRHELTLADAQVISGRAVALTPESVRCADGSIVHADQIIDCRGGFTRNAPTQTAFGVVVAARDAAPILDGAQALLMQWSAPDHLGALPDQAPSFLYAIPLSAHTVLLEETCLAGYPPLGIDELTRRLRVRLGDQLPSAIRSESVSIPLTGAAAPWRTRVFAYGAAGGLTHPTTGYSVAASLRYADLVAAAIAAGHDPTTTLWPSQARAVHRLRLRSLGALLALDATQLLDFFDAFFTLPLAAQQDYLSERGNLRGTVAAMIASFGRVTMRTRFEIARGTLAHPAWAGNDFVDDHIRAPRTDSQ
ncbi:MAG: lycopene cyclase family protein [Gordonia sp. (in: high G+C Gram-positive bacteria)]